MFLNGLGSSKNNEQIQQHRHQPTHFITNKLPSGQMTARMNAKKTTMKKKKGLPIAVREHPSRAPSRHGSSKPELAMAPQVESEASESLKRHNLDMCGFVAPPIPAPKRLRDAQGQCVKEVSPTSPTMTVPSSPRSAAKSDDSAETSKFADAANKSK